MIATGPDAVPKCDGDFSSGLLDFSYDGSSIGVGNTFVLVVLAYYDGDMAFQSAEYVSSIVFRLRMS